MNKRQNSILLETLRNKNTTISAYSDQYKVSEQTIRNDIKEINHILKTKCQPAMKTNADGQIYFDNITLQDQKTIEAIVKDSDFYSYKLSPEERMTVLAMALLNAESYVTISHLSEIVLVSRNTIMADLDELRKWFHDNKMALVSQTRKGYIVNSTEKQIRAGILKLIVLNTDVFAIQEDLIFKSLLIEELDQNHALPQIEKILKEWEEFHDVYLSDFSYREMVYTLLILINRMSKQKYIEILDNQTDIAKSSKFPLAEELLHRLCKEFNLLGQETEIYYLTSELRAKSYLKNNGPNIVITDIQILINEFIFKISHQLGINYYLDFYLYDLLLEHIKAAVFRIKQNQPLKNPLMDQIYQNHPHICQEVASHLSPLENYMGETFTTDEISYIVIYILAIIEKNKESDLSVHTVLVCNSGRGTAQLISAMLHSISKQIRIIEILSSHNLRLEKRTDIDLVITTVPLQDIAYKHIQINPILTEEDIIAIQKAIRGIQQEKQKLLVEKDTQYSKEKTEPDAPGYHKTGARFQEILHESCIKLNEKAANWEEAVNIAGTVLINQNKAHPEFVSQMIHNIHENGPYIVIHPGVAIPHAEAKNRRHPVSASFIRLKEPVTFHHETNDPVRYIIALSIASAENIARALYNFTKILGMGEFMEQINQAMTPKEIMAVIQKFEDTFGG